MANGKVLRQLIKAGATGDVAAFRRVSEVIIEEERQKQHHLLANDLEHILYGDHAIQTSRVPAAPPVPVDKERGLPLLDIRQPSRSLDEIVLPESSSDAVEEIFEVVLKWFTEFGHLNRSDMLTSEQHRCSNEKKKFQS